VLSTRTRGPSSCIFLTSAGSSGPAVHRGDSWDAPGCWHSARAWGEGANAGRL